MINPYITLTPELLQAMLHQPLYFVRQYYQRGREAENTKMPLLYSHYSHHEIDTERARRHLRILWNDSFRFLYNSENSGHLEKLKRAAGQPQGYKIYTNVMQNVWTAPAHIKAKVNCYLKKNYAFDTGNPNEQVRIRIKDLFGEFYLVLNWQGKKAEVTLDEIETIPCHVL